MVNESIAIIALLTAAAVTTIKARKELYVVLILPIFSVPVFYVLSRLVAHVFKLSYSASFNLEMGFVIAGGIIGSIVSFVVSHFLSSTESKAAYTVLGIIFSLGLMGAYIINIC